MPVVFINGITLEETDPVKLRQILRDKVGISLCFLNITRFTHLLFYGSELWPVKSSFNYTDYDEVVKLHKLTHFKYRRVCKCVSMEGQDAEIVEDDNGQKYVLKRTKRDKEIEAVILSNCDHPNVIGIHELYVHNNELIMIQEYAGYGDLFDFIATKGNDLSNSYNEIIEQIADGLNYLHSKGYAHLDLKLDNIVIKSLSPIKVALIDFELSLTVPYTTDRQFGTPDYLPPEIAKRSYDRQYKYDKDCDVWMLGVVILILFHNAQYHPFGSEPMALIKRGLENPRIIKLKPFWPKNMPKKYEDLATTLLVEREFRPTINEVIQKLRSC